MPIVKTSTLAGIINGITLLAARTDIVAISLGLHDLKRIVEK